MNRRAIVTGGAGFIGSNLVRALLAENWTVDVLDNFDPFYDPVIKRRNVEPFLDHERFRLFETDIRDREAVCSAFEGDTPAAVFHLAARAGVRPSIEDPLLYNEVNLYGTSVVLEASRLSGAAKIIFASSSSVYGNNDKVPFAETDSVDRPISPYAATKKAGEVLCHAHHHLTGTPIACLRYFTVYGPGQRPEMAIHYFTRCIERGVPLVLYGDGTTERDYTFVDDIVRGTLAACERIADYAIWNLGGSRTTRLDRLVELVSGAIGREPLIDRQPMQPGDVERTWADISRAGRDLDWQPDVPIEEGVRRFVDWYEECMKA